VNAASSSSGRILELDGLRALAVLAVISFHYTIANPLANRVTGLGWVGVDLFFVLSGYLITSILVAARPPRAATAVAGQPRARYFSTFYARRTLRIFPIYYLLLFVYILAARIGGGPQPWTYWLMHAAYLSSSLEFFHYWAFAAPTFVYAGVSVLWSLSIEEQFYLMWAPVVRYLPPRRLWMVLVGVVVGAPVLRFFIHTAGHAEYEFLPARFDALAWGAMLALVWTYWSRDGRAAMRYRRVMLGAGAVLSILIALTGGTRASHWFATLGYTALAVFFAGVVGWTVARAGTASPAARLQRWRPGRYLGRISYTVYLVHYPVYMLVGAAMNGWLGGWPGAGWWGTAARGLVSVAVAIAVAGASWRFLESPILRLKDRWAPSPRWNREPQPVLDRIEEAG